MAIQVVCFYCDKQFLLRSDNTDDISIELECRKLEITCPYCNRINYEFLLTSDVRFDKVRVSAESDQNQSEQDAMQRTMDFYNDYGPVVNSAPHYITSEELLAGADSVKSFAFEQAQKEVFEEIEREGGFRPRSQPFSGDLDVPPIPDGPLPYRRVPDLDESGNFTGAYRIEGQPNPDIMKTFRFPPDEYRDRPPSVGPEDFGGEDFPASDGTLPKETPTESLDRMMTNVHEQCEKDKKLFDQVDLKQPAASIKRMPGSGGNPMSPY